jgi:pimeloyl-ACP methyl ester carboxylesterase
MLLEIAAPTLVLVGALDNDVPSATNHMAAKIPGARNLAFVPAGHAANIEVAEAFNSAVPEILEEI